MSFKYFSLQQARKLCPGIITIPYEFERSVKSSRSVPFSNRYIYIFSYKHLSLLFYTILMSHADDLQAVSVDEALIDVTTTVNQLRSHARNDGIPYPANDLAETIRAQVRQATSCEGSFLAFMGASN